MRAKIDWAYKCAAAIAVAVGVLLVLGGAGHLSAILQSRAGQPFDYRFVSLLTTSGILIFPGLVGLITSYWLWRGRTWAYMSNLLSTSALTLYLLLLMYMRMQVPDSAVGSELYFMSAAALVFLVTLLSVLVWKRTAGSPPPAGGHPNARERPAC